MNMYVSNLATETNDEALRNLFTPYGKVTSAKVIVDRETGFSRGFGFVEMESTKDGETAIKNLHQKEVGGKTISVSEARPKTQRTDNKRW
jgi:RNA recognition motif-containing protein